MSMKEIQSERERISADLHDELGSGISAIRLLSEVARNKMKENVPAEIEKISNFAKELLSKIDCIIWSMNAGNDTLDNLIAYIRSYALEYFEGTPIQCKVNEPEAVYEKEVEGLKRRNIFLCIKEILNNAWKHSGCTSITIDIDTDEELCIRIVDNGKGLNPAVSHPMRNGLRNMEKRMESIGGRFTIKDGQGTVTILQLPL